MASNFGVKVEKKDAQKAIQILNDLGMRESNLKPLRSKNEITIPISKKTVKLETALKRNKIDFEFNEREFESYGKTSSLKEELKNKLNEKELDELITSFDSLGSIAVIEIPESLQNKQKVIAEALLKVNPSIKTVCVKAEKVKGKFRVYPVKVIAGKDTTIALYKESGCRFKVALGEVFFSPRLSHERERISKIIKKGEVIAALFAGVGPFPIIFAKNSKMKKAYAVELNPRAVELMEENIKINKLPEGKVIPILGDVKNREVIKKLKSKCDRVVMPLPKGGENFLQEAIECIKDEGGIIHFYQFVPLENPYSEVLEFIAEAVKMQGRKHKVLRKEKVRNFSSTVIQVVVDFWVE